MIGLTEKQIIERANIVVNTGPLAETIIACCQGGNPSYAKQMLNETLQDVANKIIFAMAHVIAENNRLIESQSRQGK